FRQAEPINKTRATQIEIQSTGRGRNAKPVLNKTGGRGQKIVRALCAKQDEVDVLRTADTRVKQLSRGGDAQILCAFIRRGNMPFMDAVLFVDLLNRPARKGVGQIGSGQDSFRKVIFDGLNSGV